MVEIIIKIIKSEGPLRVTPPKIKKIKKNKGKGGCGGCGGTPGGGVFSSHRRQRYNGKEGKTRNTLIYNNLHYI